MEFPSLTDYRTVFNALPGASALLLPNSPEYTIIASTEEFAAFGGTTREQMVGSSLFTHFPDNPDAPNVSDIIRESLVTCIRSGRKNELPLQRYDIANHDGSFSEKYWTVIHSPILDEKGEISFIIHTAIDLTDRMNSDLKDKKIKKLEPANKLFMQSSVAIHLFIGPDLIVELANDPTLKLWARDASIIGKPLREVLPELEKQHYIGIIDNVRLTGIPYHAHEERVDLIRNGKEESGYFNFVLQPYYEDAKSMPVGVLAMVNEVTDIIKNRKALAEKERSLELAAEIGDLGVFTIDLRSNTVSYSPQVMDWFSVTRLNLPLEELLQRVHPEDYEMVTSTLSRLTKGQRSWRHDIVFRVPHHDTGKMQYLRSIGQVQFEDDDPVTLSGIIQDITISKQSQEALQQSAQRLKSLIDSAPFPIGVYTGREMRIEMVNQAILDVWGRDASVVGRTYSEVLPELIGQGPFEQLDQVYSTGKAFHAINTRVDIEKDGLLSPYYFNYSFTPLFDSLGKVYGVMNTAAEVTDLVVAKQKLEQSERNFRNIILQAPVAMCLLRGPEHRVEISNEFMLKIWGKDIDVVGKPIFEILPDAKGQGLENMLEQVFTTGKAVAMNELPVRLNRFGKDEIVYQNFLYEPYRDGDGGIIGIIATSLDVTQQVIARHKIEDVVKERTRELELANERLKRSNAELEQFAYIASHDLQEPLRKINLFTEGLQETLGDENPKARYHMERIVNSVGRMMNLIRDILEYSQLSRQNEVFVETNLEEEVFADAIADFDVVCEEKNATITCDSLPVIEANPLQMVQLFANLISNSLKYSRADVAPKIHVTGEKISAAEVEKLGLNSRNTYHKIIFRDNGIGFNQEYADKIFNIFQRLHAKNQYGGTGIGLAMCKKIVENHHGYISASAIEGEGAEFTVILPEHQN
ncbi:MAG: PAS domain-containing protein [Flavobacterium sp.]|nr:MAG: PAS domain-containing protein [Flavobacterium sp.]